MLGDFSRNHALWTTKLSATDKQFAAATFSNLNPTFRYAFSYAFLML